MAEENKPVPYKPLLGRALCAYDLQAVRVKIMVQLARAVQKDRASFKDGQSLKDQGF